jgi:hypothetical protein
VPPLYDLRSQALSDLSLFQGIVRYFMKRLLRFPARQEAKERTLLECAIPHSNLPSWPAEIIQVISGGSCVIVILIGSCGSTMLQHRQIIAIHHSINSPEPGYFKISKIVIGTTNRITVLL